MASLAIGMAVYNDYSGVWACLQGLRALEASYGVQFIVVDNYGCKHTQHLCEYWQAAKYVLAKGTTGTAYPRNQIFANADTDFVMCVDSHVGLMSYSLGRLRRFLDTYPDCDDLLQGPLLYDNLREYSTHFIPKWDTGMWGKWGTDRRGESPDAPPFEIPMQGLGLFVARRQSWAGFNPHFRGFGGEEGYIHGKYLERGNRTLCLPFLRWYHRFHRTGEKTTYPNKLEDRVFNYYVGFMELGWDTEEVTEHFKAQGLSIQSLQRIHAIADAKNAGR